VLPPHDIFAQLCPTIVSNYFVIVHLYAGRKRPGVMSDLAPLIAGIALLNIIIIPLDIVSGNASHNCLDPRTLSFIVQAVLAKKIHAMVAGPPCETWSKVRERQLKDGTTNVLRLLDLPWGRIGLRPKHLDQLFVANELLCTCLLIFSALLVTGGSAIIEHPARPSSPTSVSIWKLDLVKRLMMAPGVALELVNQGPLGQTSPKPTHLLCLRTPHLQRAYRDYQILNRHVKAAPQYLADGSFATAPMKEYPCRFSAMLLTSFWSAVRNPNAHPGAYSEVTTTLRNRCTDIESDNLQGITPRPQDVTGLDDVLQMFMTWPEGNSNIGPDFNTHTISVIHQSTNPHSSRQDFPALVQEFLAPVPPSD
jgi:hypothetical protein